MVRSGNRDLCETSEVVRVVVLGYKTQRRLGAVIEQHLLLLTMSQLNFDTPELRNADTQGFLRPFD